MFKGPLTRVQIFVAGMMAMTAINMTYDKIFNEVAAEKPALPLLPLTPPPQTPIEAFVTAGPPSCKAVSAYFQKCTDERDPFITNLHGQLIAQISEYHSCHVSLLPPKTQSSGLRIFIPRQ